jgi:hypothetical protein
MLQASVVKGSTGSTTDTYTQDQNAPAPAAVTISKVQARVPGGIHLTQVAGVAVREYGTLIPNGSDGSFTIYERLDKTEATRWASVSFPWQCSWAVM